MRVCGRFTGKRAGVDGFSRDARGNVAIIFALVLVPVLVLIGLALDTGRAMLAAKTAQGALDASALAAAQALTRSGADDDEIARVANDYFRANGGDKVAFASFGPLSVTSDRATGAVTVAIDTVVPTTLGALAQVEEISMRRSSTAVMGMSEIELGLMLDVTGSMDERGKLQALKRATNDLFDTLIPDGGRDGRVRIGLAPYSAAVNAGRYADAVSGGESRDDCVVNRDGRDTDTDRAPVRNAYFRSIQQARDEFGGRRGRNSYNYYACPDAEVLPLTSDKARLSSTVNGYNATGRTAGHLGIAWAWYLLSPDWGSVWGAGAAKPYGTKDLIKAVVLMTDGEFNAAYAGSDDQSAASRESFRRAESLCENARREGVVIFSVAFDLRDEDAERALSDCASSENYFFRAESEDELRRAYRNIAIKLNELRISK